MNLQNKLFQLLRNFHPNNHKHEHRIYLLKPNRIFNVILECHIEWNKMETLKPMSDG